MQTFVHFFVWAIICEIWWISIEQPKFIPDTSVTISDEFVINPSFGTINDGNIIYDNPFLGGFNKPKIQWLDWNNDGRDDIYNWNLVGNIMHLNKSETKNKGDDSNELLTKEINAGIYVIENSCLFNYIPKINNENAQEEYYLPDLINLMIDDGKSIASYKTSNVIEISGVNNKNQLNELESYLRITRNN